MRLNRFVCASLFLVSISACGPMVDVTDLTTVGAEKIRLASEIPTYTFQQIAPSNYKVIAPVTAYSCKSNLYDPPASKGNALLQLQLKALDQKANAIVNVTFDTRGTDTFGTNCWETVQASGLAVLY